MRYTLLDLTEIILSSMDGDEVNSIHDTTESQSVVKCIQTTYYDIASRGNLTRHTNVFQLTPSGVIARPVTMSLPSDIADVKWIKYNAATAEHPEPNFTEVQPLPLEDFLDIILNLNTTEPDVISYTEIINGSSVQFLAKNVQAPKYYTSIDDTTLIFDSYDAGVDSTLQGAKTMCFGQREFPWTEEDTFIPDLDEKQHQLLLNEAKSLCFAELKQAQHAKAEKTSRQLWINQQSAKTKVPLRSAQQRGPNYGRKK